MINSGDYARLYFSDLVDRYIQLEKYRNVLEQINVRVQLSGPLKEALSKWIKNNGPNLLDALKKVKKIIEEQEGTQVYRLVNLADLPEDMKQFGTLNEFSTGLKSLCDGLMKVIQESITKEV